MRVRQTNTISVQVISGGGVPDQRSIPHTHITQLSDMRASIFSCALQTACKCSELKWHSEPIHICPLHTTSLATLKCLHNEHSLFELSNVKWDIDANRFSVAQNGNVFLRREQCPVEGEGEPVPSSAHHRRVQSSKASLNITNRAALRPVNKQPTRGALCVACNSNFHANGAARLCSGCSPRTRHCPTAMITYRAALCGSVGQLCAGPPQPTHPLQLV